MGDNKSSPCRQSTKSVFFSPASPFFPIMGWQLGALSPEQLPVSQEHQRLLEPSGSECCSQPVFWGLDPRLVLGIGGSCHACKVLVGVEERAMKWPSSGLKIPPLSPLTPLTALSSQHSMGDSRSSQAVLCQQQTNWDYYLLSLTCQGSCLTQALIIVVIYFLSDVLRARSRAVSLWEAQGALQHTWCWGPAGAVGGGTEGQKVYGPLQIHL